MKIKTKLIKGVASCLLCMLVVNTPIFYIHAETEDSIEITAPSAVLMEPQTGKVIFEKSPMEQRCCASITKVMTMILVMEAIDSGNLTFTDTVTASEHAASMGGSDIWLKEGETMTVDDMIKAVMVASANDAAVALAEHIDGSEDVFVKRMNDKAKELGMENTVFKNCNGLDEEGHVTCAYDVALMSRELIKHKKIFDYTSIWMDYLRDGKTQLVNTNKLLKSYKGITGLKTGTTSAAGSCISATATRNGLSLISVVLGSVDGKSRFKDAATLLDYGFANYSMVEPLISEDMFEPINVINGMKEQIHIKPIVDGNILIQKGQEKLVESSLELLTEVEAPVKEETIVGRLIYKIDGEVISQYNVVASENIEKISFLSLLKKFYSGLMAI